MSNKATKEEQDFAVVMQQLSAEAEKIMPVFAVEEKILRPTVRNRRSWQKSGMRSLNACTVWKTRC